MPVVQPILIPLQNLLARVAVSVKLFEEAAFAAGEVGEIDHLASSGMVT